MVMGARTVLVMYTAGKKEKNEACIYDQKKGVKSFERRGKVKRKAKKKRKEKRSVF